MIIIKYKKQYKKKKIINIKKKFIGLLQYGFFGLQAKTSGILDIKQLENIRRIFIKISKRTAKIFIRVFFEKPKTAKPLLSRMGKGVGNINLWISYIKKGQIFLEVMGISKNIALKTFQKILFKLPFKINFIMREVFENKVLPK